MDEKTIQRIKKLQALAERGVGGEKTTAQKKLAKLLKDNGINSLDELQEEEYEYTIFSYNGKHEIKLLRQCMYKVMGAKSDRTAYKPYGRRRRGRQKAPRNLHKRRVFRGNRRVRHKRTLLRGSGRDTESVRKLSVYGWRCSHSKGRHGRTAVCSSNTEAV